MPTQPEDIYATLTNRGLDTLVAAVDAAEPDHDLQAPGSFTLLAPSDAAFAALPAGTLDTLPGHRISARRSRSSCSNSGSATALSMARSRA